MSSYDEWRTRTPEEDAAIKRRFFQRKPDPDDPDPVDDDDDSDDDDPDRTPLEDES